MKDMTDIFVGFRKRLVAFLLDFLLIGAYILILLTISVLLESQGSPLRKILQGLFSNSLYGEVSAFFFLTLPVVLYFAFSESSRFQASWGKRRMGIKVADLSGNRLSFARSLFRSAVKFVPWEFAHFFLWMIPGWPFNLRGNSPSLPVIIGFTIDYSMVIVFFASLIIGKTHRTVYDRLSGTKVIYKKDS